MTGDEWPSVMCPGSQLLRGCRYWALAFCGCLALMYGASAQTVPSASVKKESAKLSFNQTVQPILSENCYACHGPDPGARKAKLRLDRAEFAYAPHDKSGPAIIP